MKYCVTQLRKNARFIRQHWWAYLMVSVLLGAVTLTILWDGPFVAPESWKY